MEEKTDKPKIMEGEVPKTKMPFGIRHLQMAAMAAVLIALLFTRSSMAVAVLAMTDQKRANVTEVYAWNKKTQGNILSSFFWGYAAMQIPAGLLAKRFGGKPMLAMAMMSNSILCLALPTLARLGGWPLVCLARMLTGATQACLFPSCHTLLGRWLPAHEITTYSGLVYGASNIGIILSMPTAGVLAETSYGWPSIFYTSAAIMMTVSLFWWWLSASSPAEHRWCSEEERAYIVKGLKESGPKNTFRTPWMEFLKSRGFWAIAIAHFDSVICYMLFLADLPTYLEKGLNISLKDSSILSALPYVGQLIGTVVSTKICDILVNNNYLSLLNARRLFTAIGLFGSGLCLIALTFVDAQYKTLAVAILISTLTLYSFTSAGWVINHLDLSPNYAGVMLSLTNCAANVGSVITPITISHILRNDPTDVSRWRVVFIVVGAMSTVATVLYAFLSEASLKPWNEPGYLDRKDADPEEMKPALQREQSEKCDATDKIKHESLTS